MNLIIGDPDGHGQREQDKHPGREEELPDGFVVTTYKEGDIDLGETLQKAPIFVSRKERDEMEPNSEDDELVRRAYYGDDVDMPETKVSSKAKLIDEGQKYKLYADNDSSE
jgi:hypothetical protein